MTIVSLYLMCIEKLICNLPEHTRSSECIIYYWFHLSPANELKKKKKKSNPQGINLAVSRRSPPNPAPFCMALMMKENLLSLDTRAIYIKLLSTVSALPQFLRKLPFSDD